MAHVAALAQIMAPGVGDAPIFPATIRILDSLLGGSHDPNTPQRDLHNVRWECPDGSIICHDDGP